MKKTDLAKEQERTFLRKLDEYGRAYEDYDAMCDEQGSGFGKLPFCCCWPEDEKRRFSISLTSFFALAILLALELSQIGILRDTEASLFSAFVIATMCFAILALLVTTLKRLFPDQYWSARQIHYGNILYFRSKSEKDLAKLELALSVISEAVAPYREQQRLEEEERRRLISTEMLKAKEKHLASFQLLKGYMDDTLGLGIEDFDAERFEGKFSVLIANPKGIMPLILRKFEYSEEGSNSFVDWIAEVEAAQTKERTQQKLHAMIEELATDGNP